MPRVKRGVLASKRRKNVLKQAKGFTGSNRRIFSRAKMVLERALAFATRDRKQLKREMRKLWITRINAAAREEGLSYSKLIKALKDSDVRLNRKILSELAVVDPAAFKTLVKSVSQKTKQVS